MSYLTAQNNLPAVRTEQDLPHHITFEQFKTVYYALAGNLKDQVLWGLLWETGGRINDVLSLRWQDINLDTKTIKLFVDKRDATITVTFAEGLMSDLKNLKMQEKPQLRDYLFPGSGKTGHIRRESAYLKIRGWGAKYLNLSAKSPGCLHPHMLRHGLAIYLMYHAELPGDITGRAQIIAARLGHASTNMIIKYYLVITPEIQKYAMQNVAWR